MYEPEYHYTLEDYWKVADADPNRKYEYVEGHIRLMTGGTLAHAQLIIQIASLLNVALRDSECNVYGSDAAVRLNEKHVYYPDVSVSCDPADWKRKRALESPTVVVEVLSPTTKKIDRGEKLIAYQHVPAIMEILYVDARRRSIEHHHRMGPHTWEVSYYTDEGDVIALSSIKVSFTLREVYTKVYLEMEDASEA